MDVREPTVDDGADLASVHAEAWRSAYRGILPDDIVNGFPVEPPDDRVAGWRDRVEAEPNRMLVATVDDDVVGYANVRLEETKPFVGDDEAELKELYVDPDSWGEGAGTALLEVAIDALPGWVDVVRLQTFRENDLAAGFYLARGFEQTGEAAFEVGGSEYATDVYSRSLD